jgi:hypothetical protein
VPTNYGYGYLTDGTYITFILKNGVYTVQTPTSLAGRTVTKNADGTYTLKQYPVNQRLKSLSRRAR